MRKKLIRNNQTLKQNGSIEFVIDKNHMRLVTWNKEEKKLSYDIVFNIGIRMRYEGELLNYMKNYILT